MPLAYAVHDSEAGHELAIVDAGIDGFNQAVEALRDVRHLSVFAKDDAGTVRGGAVGRSWGRCCELQQLWVDRDYTGQRVGSELMLRFETAATLRGCDLVYLDTFSFQAPAFYAKRGYRVVLETCGYSGGIVKFTMHRALTGG